MTIGSVGKYGIWRILFVLVFFCLSISYSYSQNNRPVEPLLSQLQSSKEDTGRVKTLIHLSRQQRQASMYEESKKYAQKALALSEKLDYREGMAYAYNLIGEGCRFQGNYAQALKNYISSLKIWEQLGNKMEIGTCYTSIGIIYNQQGNHAEALKNHLAALALGKQTNNWPGVAGAYNLVGHEFVHQGKYKEALEYHQESLKIWSALGIKRRVSITQNHIGTVLLKQGKLDQALEHFMASLKIGEEIREPRTTVLSCNNIGKIYTRLDKLKEAKLYLNKGLTVSKQFGLKENIKDAYQGLARLDSMEGNYHAALVNFQLYTNYKDSLLNETNTKLITEIREQYESEKKDQDIQQLELILKGKQDSLIIAKTAHEKVQLTNDNMHALNLFNQQRFELLDKEKRIQDLQMQKDKAEYSVQKAESDKRREQLTVLNKEKALHQLQLKKQKQTKVYFIAGLILFLIASLLLYRYYYTKQKLKMLTLRNKIASDLHDDIGSTLSSISIFSQMAQQQSKESIPLLETIGESSRKMLDAMADIVWTINPDNDQFEKIILRMRNFAYELLGARQIEFRFVSDDSSSQIKLPMVARRNLYLIFKEATNNMVKYADASQARFSINGDEGKLFMMIQDNGKGFDLNRMTEGNGLKNMKKRAQEIRAILKIDSIPGSGTTIQIEMAV